MKYVPADHSGGLQSPGLHAAGGGGGVLSVMAALVYHMRDEAVSADTERRDAITGTLHAMQRNIAYRETSASYEAIGSALLAAATKSDAHSAENSTADEASNKKPSDLLLSLNQRALAAGLLTKPDPVVWSRISGALSSEIGGLAWQIII